MKSKATILIIDDDPMISSTLVELLESEQYHAKVAQTGKAGRQAFQIHHPPIVLLDQELPDSTGIEVCRDILEMDPAAKIIFITAHASVRYAVDAMQAGAFNYLPKPFSLDELLIAVRLAENSLRLEGKLKVQEYKNKQQRFMTEMVGRSEAAERLRGQIQLAAASEAAVLITGETGVGKNLIAREIHQRQNQREPFLSINCSAIPENLMEAEYFGHEKGAFTGADNRREGIFELADGGTLLLDEIGDIPYHLQSKLLSVLEEKQVRRVGGAHPIHVDVRIIALTNRDLASAIRENRFREDLFYRLAVIQIHVPPLRRHIEDIPAIATYFAQTFCGGEVTIPEAQLQRLADYAWPGNVRELRNVIERASLLRQDNTIHPADLLGTGPAEINSDTGADIPQPDEITPLEELIQKHIRRALEACSGNKSQAAKCLGLSLSTLKRKIKSL
ncbi:MAG: sigma-54-dependent Fis family transcriptional regulator [Desulfobacterales bacterium]|nr:sigma-54-dependent Fis family transcriptional regulator [Desulfobacterales bacterium]